MPRIGPQVRKLIAHKAALLSVPPGSADPLAAAVDFLRHRLASGVRQATVWVEAALAQVKAAADNPYGDDEAIAAAILARLEAQRSPQPSSGDAP